MFRFGILVSTFLITISATAGTEYYLGTDCSGTRTRTTPLIFEKPIDRVSDWPLRKYKSVLISLNKDENSDINFFNAINLTDDDRDAAPFDIIVHTVEVLRSPVMETGNLKYTGDYITAFRIPKQSADEVQDYGHTYSSRDFLGNDHYRWELLRIFSNSDGSRKIDYEYGAPIQYPIDWELTEHPPIQKTSIACEKLQSIESSQVSVLIKQTEVSGTIWSVPANYMYGAFGANFNQVPFYDEVEVQIKDDNIFGRVRFSAVKKLDETNTSHRWPRMYQDSEYEPETFEISPTVENGLLPEWITRERLDGRADVIIRRKTKDDNFIIFEYVMICKSQNGRFERCKML